MWSVTPYSSVRQSATTTIENNPALQMEMQSEKCSARACCAKDKPTHMVDSMIKYQLMNKSK